MVAKQMVSKSWRISPWIAALVGVVVVLLSSSVPVAAGSSGEVDRAPRRIKVVPSDASDDDEFGASISGWGSDWVIGSPGNSARGLFSGAAYVYETDAEGNGLETKLVPSGAGYVTFVADTHQVALDGDTVILAGDSTQDDYESVAWVFERGAPGEWEETQKLLPADAVNGLLFAESVALEGDVAAFGAPIANGESPGSIYLYERDADGVWVEHQRLFPSEGDVGDRFGTASALDGDLLVVGAPGGAPFQPERPGQAYVFRRGPDGFWSEEAFLANPFSEDGDFYGVSVAVDAAADPPRVIVGANNSVQVGSAYVFERDEAGAWNPVAKLDPDGAFPGDFAQAVAVEGDLLAVGDPGNSDLGTSNGAVYGYQRQEDGSWAGLGKLYAPGAQSFDDFGDALGMDDTLLLVGSPGSGVFRGSVWVHRLP